MCTLLLRACALALLCTPLAACFTFAAARAAPEVKPAAQPRSARARTSSPAAATALVAAASRQLPAEWQVASPYGAARGGSARGSPLDPYSPAGPGPRDPDAAWPVADPYGVAALPTSPLAGAALGPLGAVGSRTTATAALAPSSAASASAGDVPVSASLSRSPPQRHDGIFEMAFAGGTTLLGTMSFGKRVREHVHALFVLAGGLMDSDSGPGGHKGRGAALGGLGLRFPFFTGWFKPFFELNLLFGYAEKLDFVTQLSGGLGVQLDYERFGFVLSFRFGGALDAGGSSALRDNHYLALFVGPQFRF